MAPFKLSYFSVCPWPLTNRFEALPLGESSAQLQTPPLTLFSVLRDKQVQVTSTGHQLQQRVASRELGSHGRCATVQ